MEVRDYLPSETITLQFGYWKQQVSFSPKKLLRLKYDL